MLHRHLYVLFCPLCGTNEVMEISCADLPLNGPPRNVDRKKDERMQQFFETHYIHGVHAGLATVRPPITFTPIEEPKTVN